METQCFAGASILLKKSTFQSISLQDECWMDLNNYPLGEDLVFSYILYRYGYKVLFHSNCGIIHLDAQSGHESNRDEHYRKAQYIRYIIWLRCVFQPDHFMGKIIDIMAFYSRWAFRYLLAVISLISGWNS